MTHEQQFIECAKRLELYKKWFQSGLSVIEYFNVEVEEKARSCWNNGR